MDGRDDSAADALLARRVAAGGDAAAEAELCRRLFPRIRAYGLRHLRDAAGAADLAQQVLVVLIESLRAGNVQDPERLPAFVMGTARNTVLDWRRGERTRGALLARYGPSLASVVEAETGTVDTAALARCLEHLLPREKLVVLLTFYADRDGDEIATELATSAGNVRVTRHRALRHLHDCLTGPTS